MGKRWMALLAAMGMTVCLGGCSQQDAVKAAGAIHAYLPAVMGLTNDASMVAEALDPSETSTLRAVSAKVQAELQELEAVSGAYVAAPSADGWSKLVAVVDALVGDADEGLMAAVAIKNPESQMRAKLALSALDAAVHVVDGYVMAARSPQQAKAVAEQRTVKLQQVVRYWSAADRQRVEQALGVGEGEAFGL
jgi:alcohol dehydrogenase class IV